MRADLGNALASAVLGGLSEAVEYTPTATSVAEEIRGVFDVAKKVIVEDGSSAPTTSTRPSLWIRLEDLTVAPVQGDRFVPEDGATYEVTDVQRDGIGGADLFAFEVAE